LSKTRYLPDVNVLLALTIRSHEFYSIATQRFQASGSSEFLLCPLTETGFLRLSSEPKVGNQQLRDAIFLLREFSGLPGFRYRPIPDSWLNTADSLFPRLGHLRSQELLKTHPGHSVRLRLRAVLVRLARRGLRN
jgi:predicted nucleic acid-binding protein